MEAALRSALCAPPGPERARSHRLIATLLLAASTPDAPLAERYARLAEAADEKTADAGK
jgi:hypothetical protein